MKRATKSFDEMIGQIPPEIKAEFDLTFAISDRIDALMKEKGLTKKELADALGTRTYEVTKWLSGQYNFSMAIIAKLTVFFGQPIIKVV